MSTPPTGGSGDSNLSRRGDSGQQQQQEQHQQQVEGEDPGCGHQRDPQLPHSDQEQEQGKEQEQGQAQGQEVDQDALALQFVTRHVSPAAKRVSRSVWGACCTACMNWIRYRPSSVAQGRRLRFACVLVLTC